MSFHNHDTDEYNKRFNPSGRKAEEDKKEEGMIEKHLKKIKQLGFYYELVYLLDLQRKECLASIMKTDFYLRHKNDFPKSYILSAPMPKEVDQWKDFMPNSEQTDNRSVATESPSSTGAGSPDTIKTDNQ